MPQGQTLTSKLFAGFRPIISTLRSSKPSGKGVSSNTTPSSYALPAYPAAGNVLVPLLNSKDIFSAEDAIIQKARSGDDIWISIYEFQNEKINGGSRTANGISGHDEQQQLIPDLVAAQARGAQVHVVVDVSKGWGKPSENLPMIDYLSKQGIQILPYPSKLAKIDHTKNLVLAHKAENGNTEYWGVGAGGMNMGNHSAANHDTMVLMAGTAPYNMLVHVIRPQWIVSGGDSSLIPSNEVNDPEVKWLNTAAHEEQGGGVPEIKNAYLSLIHKAMDLKEQGQTPHIRTAQFVLSNPAVTYALRDAAQAGVDVQVLLDPNIYMDQIKDFMQRTLQFSQGSPQAKELSAELSLDPQSFARLASSRDLSELESGFENDLVCLHSNEGKETHIELGDLGKKFLAVQPGGSFKFKPGTTWAHDLLLQAGAKVKFFDADTKIQQKLHDKWISLSYTDASGKDIPVELISGSANASKSGLETGGKPEPSPHFSFSRHMSVLAQRVPAMPIARYFAKSGKSQPNGKTRYPYRTNREADALILNRDCIRSYNQMFDNLMANQSVEEPPSGSGDSSIF